MKTSILSRHTEVDDTLRRYVHTRIQSALQVLITRVVGITVQLKAENGLSGPRQKTCEIEIQLGDNQTVVVKSGTSHWLAAIDQAVEAAARAVRREVGRGMAPLKPLLVKGAPG